MGYDRTQEFFQAVEELSIGGSNGRRNEARASFSDADRAFNALAGEMGGILHNTSVNLQELGKLARQRGIYDDKSAQIQELTFEIRKTITQLNSRLDALEKAATNAGTGGGHSRAHYITVTEVIKTRLMEITKEFKDILMLRTENLKKQERRRNLYSFGGDVVEEDSMNTDQHLDVESGQKVSLVRRSGNSYAQSRAEAVENVQRVIGELASIFQRVATMITHQEEMIQRIDHDLDTSMSHLRQGQGELLNYYNRISSNRSLIIKVFLLLMAFILFFVVFLS